VIRKPRKTEAGRLFTNFTAVLWYAGDRGRVWQACDWSGPSHYPWWGSLVAGGHHWWLSSWSAKGIPVLI